MRRAARAAVAPARVVDAPPHVGHGGRGRRVPRGDHAVVAHAEVAVERVVTSSAADVPACAAILAGAAEGAPAAGSSTSRSTATPAERA